MKVFLFILAGALAFPSTAQSVELTANVPTANQVQRAVNIRDNIYAGAPEQHVPVTVRKISCISKDAGFATCNFEINFCDSKTEIDKAGWCNASAQLEFGTHGWQLTSPYSY